MQAENMFVFIFYSSLAYNITEGVEELRSWNEAGSVVQGRTHIDWLTAVELEQ